MKELYGVSQTSKTFITLFHGYIKVIKNPGKFCVTSVQAM